MRIDVENGWYHITSRGINRQAIYFEDRDREHFLELVSELPERFGVLVHAYVLMSNHFHFLIQTPRANASTAMHWVKTGYTIWFNIKHDGCGPLFQGRFTSVPVDGRGSWALEASKYVHLNPVRLKSVGQGKAARKAERTGLTGGPTQEQVKERLELLRGYRWSSCRAYGGYESGPEWLTKEELWWRAGGKEADKARAYRKYIEAAVRSGGEEPSESWLEKVVWGSKRYMEKMGRYVKGDRREQGAIKEWDKPVGFEEVVRMVEKLKGEKWEDFADRHGDWGRDVALWTARKWSGMSLKELGKKAGGLDYTAVSQAVRRIEERAERDRELSKHLQTIRRQMSNVKT